MSKLILTCLFLSLLLLCNGNVESNPGPKKSKEFSLSCYHWNVNSFLAYYCAKYGIKHKRTLTQPFIRTTVILIFQDII